MEAIDLFLPGGSYAGLYNIDFKIKEGDKVLDIGGGHRPYPKSTHIIDMASSNVQRHGKDLVLEGRKFFDGDAIDILPTFPDKFFDFCYASHVFEHIPNLPLLLELIAQKCKRGFYALPGSDFEFLSAQAHYGHVNLCRQIGNTLHICRRPQFALCPEFSRVFEHNFTNQPLFNQLWEGHHGKLGYRFLWEIRYYWENEILYKFHEDAEDLYPQLKYFKAYYSTPEQK